MVEPISVLVTGSAGRVGRAACAALLARGHNVRGFDVRRPAGDDHTSIGSICNADEVRRATAGIDVVIHLAATPDDDDFMGKLLPNNIVGLYNVLESARSSGVRRVVLASTGQVVAGHQGPWPVTPEMPFSPRNWYACAKVMSEVAGQYFASVHGISVIVARLGWCPRDRLHAEKLRGDDFGKDVYLSPGDAGRFFVCTVECLPDIRFCTVFALSRPLKQARYDTSAATRILGYKPQDTWPAGTESVAEWVVH